MYLPREGRRRVAKHKNQLKNVFIIGVADSQFTTIFIVAGNITKPILHFGFAGYINNQLSIYGCTTLLHLAYFICKVCKGARPRATYTPKQPAEGP